MPSVMFDSDDPAVLLSDHCKGSRVATYADLLTADLVRQLGKRLSVIDRGQGDPLGLATIADIEPGLLTVEQGVAKIRQWITEGRHQPTAYSDRTDWPAIVTALGPLKPFHWIATLDGTANPDGKYPAVVQALGEAKLGFHADMSIVWDDLWHPLPMRVDGNTVDQLKKLVGLYKADTAHLGQLVDSL